MKYKIEFCGNVTECADGWREKMKEARKQMLDKLIRGYYGQWMKIMFDDTESLRKGAATLNSHRSALSGAGYQTVVMVEVSPGEGKFNYCIKMKDDDEQTETNCE